MSVYINLLEENIKQGRIWAKPIISWGKTVKLSIVTLGMFFIYIFVKRLNRADSYIMRKRDFFDIIINSFQKTGHDDLKGLENALIRFIKEVPLLKPFLLKLIFVFCIVLAALSVTLYRIDCNFTLATIILGYSLLTALFIYIHRMNGIWDDICFFENLFYSELETLLKKEKVFKRSFLYEMPVKMKSKFIPYLFLSLFPVPFLWLIVWDRELHYLPDKIYQVCAASEDIILETLKSRC